MKHYDIERGKFCSLRSGARGFSLIELLIGSVVFIVVLLAMYMILETSQRDYAMGAAKSDVQGNIRVVLESMARELRMAGYFPSNTDCATPPCGITVFSSSSVTFQFDANGDNITDNVVYTFHPPTNPTKPCDPIDPTTVGRITRSVQFWDAGVGGWSPGTPTQYDVAQCVKMVTFTNYNNLGGVPATAADVRRIRISVTGEENVRGQAPRSYTASTDIRLRNL